MKIFWFSHLRKINNIKSFIRLILAVFVPSVALLILNITPVTAQGNLATSLALGTTTTSVDITKTGAPIHRYTYGMFTELLGNMFDHGVWSEMVSDRKFFYPVDTLSRLIPVNSRRFQLTDLPGNLILKSTYQL
jgi:hypothetical protein